MPRAGRFLAAALVVNFLVVPLVVAVMVAFLPADDAVRIGVLLVLLTPYVDYVIVFSALAGGSSRRLLAATPLLLLAQFLLLPGYLSLLLGSEPATVVEPGPFLEAILVLIAVEARFRELEIEAVATAPETPGTRETIKALIDAGHVVVIVSNNSTAAVRRYIDTRGWKGLVALISARNSANADLLKPSPSLLLRAVEALATRPATCIMIGDSEADVDAARASGIAAIGYANKPSKHDKLTHRGADAVVSRARELFAVAPADVERS